MAGGLETRKRLKDVHILQCALGLDLHEDVAAVITDDEIDTFSSDVLSFVDDIDPDLTVRLKPASGEFYCQGSLVDDPLKARSKLAMHLLSRTDAVPGERREWVARVDVGGFCYSASFRLSSEPLKH